MGIIPYEISDRATLYSAYMPFIKKGGLFIASNANHHLGDRVSVSLKLMNDARMVITGKVVWITPEHAQGNKLQGIGIQFEEGSERVRTRIEAYLAGDLHLDRPTYTL